MLRAVQETKTESAESQVLLLGKSAGFIKMPSWQACACPFLTEVDSSASVSEISSF